MNRVIVPSITAVTSSLRTSRVAAWSWRIWTVRTRTVSSGFTNLHSAAIDAQNRRFVTDDNVDTVTVLNSTGGPAQRIFATGLEAPIGPAVDSRGHLFVATNKLRASISIRSPSTKIN